jgi:Spy/CpxP family protein refolding chaperone
MYPGMMYWWKNRRHGECGASAGCSPGGHSHEESWEPHVASHGEGGFGGGGAFGVRRPLRFLAFKLQLSEQQVADLAQILSDLKTERAQAAVDDRRVVGAFADLIAGETFDAAKATEAGTVRVRTAEHLRDAVQKALGRIHALLDPAQRAQLAYLIRTGTISI